MAVTPTVAEVRNANRSGYAVGASTLTVTPTNPYGANRILAGVWWAAWRRGSRDRFVATRRRQAQALASETRQPEE